MGCLLGTLSISSRNLCHYRHALRPVVASLLQLSYTYSLGHLSCLWYMVYFLVLGIHSTLFAFDTWFAISSSPYHLETTYTILTFEHQVIYTRTLLCLSYVICLRSQSSVSHEHMSVLARTSSALTHACCTIVSLSLSFLPNLGHTFWTALSTLLLFGSFTIISPSCLLRVKATIQPL